MTCLTGMVIHIGVSHFAQSSVLWDESAYWHVLACFHISMGSLWAEPADGGQVGGAGLGFGAPTAAPVKPAGFAPPPVPASPAETGGMQGFARSNMEANDNLSSLPSAPTSQLPPPPLPPGRPPAVAPAANPPLPPGPAPRPPPGAHDEVRQMRRGEPFCCLDLLAFTLLCLLHPTSGTGPGKVCVCLSMFGKL